MRKTYTQEQLKEIIENHRLWLIDEGGERANLSYADLRSADLSYADLRYANLRSADLRSADLSYADLRYANLRSADLSYAELSYANLSSANLYGTSTHNVKGHTILSIGNIGSRNSITTYHLENDVVFCGCFRGTLEEFKNKVTKSYEEGHKHRKEYDLAISFFSLSREEK